MERKVGMIVELEIIVGVNKRFSSKTKKIRKREKRHGRPDLTASFRGVKIL